MHFGSHDQTTSRPETKLRGLILRAIYLMIEPPTVSTAVTPTFYVHIVESPSPAELLDGLTEGRALCSFLDVAGICYSYNLAVDETQFRIAMNDRIIQAGQWFGRPPILHFSTHGGDLGIQLCQQRQSGYGIKWEQLAEYLKPIRRTIGGIGVCMSCCGGAHGNKMAQVLRPEDVPYAWIVGTHRSVVVCDAALAFAVFYRSFQRGEGLSRAIAAMNAASGVIDFRLEFGADTQQEYAQRTAELYQQWLQKQPRPVYGASYGQLSRQPGSSPR
jgi:hypothetical protein